MSSSATCSTLSNRSDVSEALLTPDTPHQPRKESDGRQQRQGEQPLADRTASPGSGFATRIAEVGIGDYPGAINTNEARVYSPSRIRVRPGA